jgi:hypothetical protein
MMVLSGQPGSQPVEPSSRDEARAGLPAEHHGGAR